MKLSNKIRCLAVVIVCLGIISCSNSSDSPSNSGSQGANETNPTSPVNPENPVSPSNPDNPGGDSSNPEIPDNPVVPKYEWINTKNESITKTDNATMYYDSNSTYDFFYSYINDKWDYQLTTITSSNTEQITGRGTEGENTSIFNMDLKSITTCVENEQGYISSGESYTKNGNEWVLSGKSTETRCKTDNGYTVTTDSYSKNENEWELASTSVIVYELINNENNVDIYKVTYSTSPTVYDIAEYKNDILINSTQYVNDKKTSEIAYWQPNNQILMERLPSYTLVTRRNYDTDGNCISERYETLEDVILDEVNNSLTIKTGQSTNTDSSYSYSTATYKRVQVPFAAD